jgi:hypothetical protein
MSNLRIALAILLWPLGSAFAQQWEAELRPDRSIEELHPRVGVVKDADSALEVRDGLFVFNTGARGGGYLGIGVNPPFQEDPPILGDAAAWDGRRPTTVEARLCVVSMASGAGMSAQLNVANGRYNYLLNVTPQGLAGLPFDATQFHTYRITLKQGVPNLYAPTD